MTRFFTAVNAEDTLSALKDVCDGLALGFKLSCTKQVNGVLQTTHSGKTLQLELGLSLVYGHS